MVTVRTLLALATAKHWHVHQLDVNNAFLHGDLDEEVYMNLPLGCKPRFDSSITSKPVCRLLKSLYGLKQASRKWFEKLTSALLHLGYHQSHTDYSLFTIKSQDSYTAVLVYVDDILVCGDNEATIKDLKEFLDDKFSIKDLGLISYYLGIEILRNSAGMFLSRKKYALDLIKEADLLSAKPLSVPMDTNKRLRADDGTLLSDANASLYRKLVGKLMYLTITRPDLSFVAQHLSQFVSTPREPHLKALFRIIRYIKFTIGQGLHFSSTNSLQLTCYSDTVIVTGALASNLAGPSLVIAFSSGIH